MTRHAALPGFRDFYPEEMALRRKIFAAWHDTARRWGFQEYDGPPLEALDLYVEKSGPEIVNQLFNFTDKGGREVALRPEMTPTFVRMLGARIKGLPRPVRWYSTPQLFRYEKQQRGRLREHFQLNMDIVGEESLLADADLLAAALDVLRSLGLTSEDVVARVSDRRLLEQILRARGVRDDQLATAYSIVDKVEREPHENLLKRLVELGLSSGDAAAVLEATGMTLDDLAGRFGGEPAIDGVLSGLAAYFDALRALGFADWIRFDMKIVRGLAYYTGIVFEIFDRKGELRAICGGGRYDHLFASLTGIDVPALGFGFGDVVLGELLRVRGLADDETAADVIFVLAAPGVTTARLLGVVAELRAAGRTAISPYREGVAIGKALKAATAAGATTAMIVSDGETVRVKRLADGSEDDVSVAKFLSHARERSER